MLTCGYRPFNSIIIAARANKSHLPPSAYHRSRRRYTKISIYKTDPETIRIIESPIRAINADSTLSAKFKYRNSVRLFAVLDQLKVGSDIAALNAQLSPLKHAVQTQPFEQVFHANRAQIISCVRGLSTASQKLTRLQWKVFTLNFFAHRDDATLWKRLSLIPRFGKQILRSTPFADCVSRGRVRVSKGGES